MAYSDVALLLALSLTVVLAYPAKDDEANYNRLHDFQDSYGKEVRNLDGIDTRDEARPLFSFLSKADKDEESEKGPRLKLDFGSSTHLDGIGGGHLVRDLDLEQGLPTSVLNVLLPYHAFVGKPPTFGVVRKYPVTSRTENQILSDDFPKDLHDYALDRSISSCFTNKRCNDGLNGDYFTKENAKIKPSDEKYAGIHISNLPRHMYSLGDGHLLNTKRSLDSIGGGHLLYSKRGGNTYNEDSSSTYKKDLDSIGGGHLLNLKKDLDSIGGGHLLNYKRELGSMEGNDFLNYKTILDSIERGPILNYKKELDSIGGGHLLNYKREFGSIEGNNMSTYKKLLDSSMKKQLLNYNQRSSSHGVFPWYIKKDMRSLDGLDRGYFPSRYTTYQQYYSGAGQPLKFSRPLCMSSRWFHQILNNYLAKEKFKSNNPKGFADDKVLAGGLKDRNVRFKVPTPRLLDVETTPDVINAWINGLTGDLGQTAEDADQSETPFSGIIELNKVYIPSLAE